MMLPPGRTPAEHVAALLSICLRDYDLRQAISTAFRFAPLGSKAGDKYLRRMLVGAAQYILDPFGSDCDLKTKGLRLVVRGGRRAKKKAVVAVARSLAVVMLSLWRNENDYQPARKVA